MRLAVVLPLAILAGFAGGYLWCWRPAAARAGGPSTTGERNAFASAVDTAAAAMMPGRAAASDKVALLLEAVRRPEDAMRSQHDLYAALQQFTADDFKSLSTDVGGILALIERFEKLPWPIGNALAEGAVERWLDLDPENALTWFRRSADLLKENDQTSATILGAIARRKPAEMLDWALSLKPGEKRQAAAQKVFAQLEGEHLKHAREWLEKIADKPTRDAAERGLRVAMAKADPLAAIEQLASLKDKSSTWDIMNTAVNEAAKRGVGFLQTLATKTNEAEVLGRIVGAVSVHDPEEGARMVSEFLAKPEAERGGQTDQPDLTGNVAPAFARKDVVRAAEWADALPEKTRLSALRQVAAVWGAQDPEAALAWLEQHPAQEPADSGKPASLRRDARTEVFGSWFRRDEQAARRWLGNLPPGELRDTMQSSMILQLAQNDRAMEAAQICAQSNVDSSGWLARRVTGALARNDPLAAATWAADLPAGAAQNHAVAVAVQEWANVDPRGAADWIAQFPESEVRDRAIAGYTQATAQFDPEAAADWVLQVNDPWQRTRAAQQVFWAMRNRDMKSADAWIRSVPGLDEAARQRLLRNLE